MGQMSSFHLRSTIAYFLLASFCFLRIFAQKEDSRQWEIETVLPERPADAEAYLCTRVALPDGGGRSLQITGIEPLSSEKLVHHMLLFGCEAEGESGGVWDCMGHGVCPGNGKQQILYGWAKGAPAMNLPNGVSYKVGSGTKINNLVLQVHYAVQRPAGDISGIRIKLSNAHLPFGAGMQMYSSYFEIPPQVESHLVPCKCCYNGFEPAHAIAFRVHTHSLGRSVYLDEVSKNGSLIRLAEHSPQLPQGFTPISGLTFWPGQQLQATCQFNSMERRETTYAGATHHNEMCNLYMIMWSELPVFWSCHGGNTDMNPHGSGGIPEAGRLETELEKFWTPPVSRLESLPAPAEPFLGQVSGVAKGFNGTIWVFHRGTRVWDGNSFTGGKAETSTHKDAIKENTILQLDQDTGEVLKSFGANQFFMPHMISMDNEGHLYVTDVALHQVFKLDQNGQTLLTLGSRLQPDTETSFCKPTQVAIARDGSIYVSDGYCNSRVAKFSASGDYIGDYKLSSGNLEIPHSVVLNECDNALLVADRENARVHRFDLDSRQPTGTWDLSQFGQVYGLTLGPYGRVFALCWKRGFNNQGPSTLVRLHVQPGDGVAKSWDLPGVEVPHDLAIIPAPLRLAYADRPIAILVAETRMWDSKLHKFILLPDDAESLEAQSQEELESMSRHWAKVGAVDHSIDVSGLRRSQFNTSLLGRGSIQSEIQKHEGAATGPAQQPGIAHASNLPILGFLAVSAVIIVFRLRQRNHSHM